MRSGGNSALRTVLWAGSLPALLVAAWLYYPFAFSGPVLCPMALALGLPCPGCGITRAFCLMTHGHFGEAVAFHGLAPFLLLYFAFLWGCKIVECVRGRPPRLPEYKIGATALGILLGFWALRLVFFFAEGGLSIMARDNLVSRLLRLVT